MSYSRQIARYFPTNSLTTSCFIAPSKYLSLSSKRYSDSSSGNSKSLKDNASSSTSKPLEEVKPKNKTQAELDQELQLKLQGLAGDGGDAGVEYEDGKPVSMKRSVRNNMFRYI